MVIADLETRYLKLARAEPVGELDAVDHALGLELPDDVKQIARFYPGGTLGGVGHFDWSATSPDSVVRATLAARRAQLVPPTFVLLAEPAESVIVLRVDRRPAVVWGHAHDFKRIVRGQSPTSDTDTYPTYGDFFEFLLQQEEEERE